MIDLDRILIPEDLLTPHHAEARAVVSSTISSLGIPLDDTACGHPYLNYLVLTHLHERLPSEWQSEPLIIYNRYFWFLQFESMYCKQHGKDAGLEQQAFQILEHATADIDWKVVEAIEDRINHKSL